MKVFVIGSTGFIGSAVAIGLRANGHQVFGLVKTPEKAKVLLHHEITPVYGDLDGIEKHSPLISECSAVIYAAPDSTINVTKVLSLCVGNETNHKLKKRFVLISGCLIYLENPLAVDENAPLNTKLGRFQTENLVLTSTNVDGVVLRPGFLYGKGGSYMGAWWKQFHAEGKISVKGKSDKKYSLIHVDDLADATVKVVESPSGVVTHEVFNVGDFSNVSVMDMAIALGKVAGYTGTIDVVPNANAYDTYFDRHARMDSSKAARLLGWRPRHIGFLEELDVYYNTWKAYNLH